MSGRFVPWLLGQRGRDDAVGDLAEDTARAVNLGLLKSSSGVAAVRAQIVFAGGGDWVLDALTEAVAEKKASGL